jgi:dTDP-4-dehydrorhamnose 3,5-epimerase
MKSFTEEYRRNYIDTNLKIFTQDNISWSKKNVVRGMHYQKTRPQGKLVRVLSGKVIDVVLDIRQNSKTYGKTECFLLNNSKIDWKELALERK